MAVCYDLAALREEPSVSVIVLGFNGGDYVRPCLESVLDQDFGRPYEILFVDNGSGDGSADVAAALQGVQVHRLGRNHGYCQGNNRGFELARAPLVVFLNQDVVVHRAWLRELVAAVESEAAIKAAHANVVHPWNPEYGAKERLRPPEVAYVPELSRWGFVEYRRMTVDEPVVDTLFLSGVSLILKRDVIEELGGYVFDPDMFAYGEDVDLALRLRGRGYRTVVATRAVLYHDHTLQDRLSLGSFIKTVRIIRNRLLALWKNAGWLEFAPLALVTLLGSPLNSGQFGLSPARRAFYSLLLVPPTFIAALAAIVAMPRYSERRRRALASKRVGRGWLLRTLVLDRNSLAVVHDSAGRSWRPL